MYLRRYSAKSTRIPFQTRCFPFQSVYREISSTPLLPAGLLCRSAKKLMCVRSFVRPFVRPSVRPSVRHAQFGSRFEQVLALLRWSNTKRVIKNGSERDIRFCRKWTRLEQVLALLRWSNTKYPTFYVFLLH